MSKCKECKCDVCKIICGKKEGIHNEEYILDMKNGWTLNHCDSSEWYLGYLVMCTTCHKKNFYELTDKELSSLGQNIKWVNCHLNSWWEKNNSNDKIEQIYLAYLNESAYKRQLFGEELGEQLHVHIHMLPRTKSMREICGVQILGWDLLKIRNCFPVHYICDFGKREELMKYLKRGFEEEGKPTKSK